MDSASHLGHACGGLLGFRLKETHSPERKYEEYFEKSIISSQGDHEIRSSRSNTIGTSRSHDLSVTRQRDGSVRSSPSTVINCADCLGSWQSLLHDFDRS